MWRLQHADVESVDDLMSRRQQAIVHSGRFRTVLTRAMLPITASHALFARLVQAGHGSAAIAVEVTSAVLK